jgi:hypothetical protein
MPSLSFFNGRPRRLRSAVCLTRTTLLALTAMVACGEGGTYYPIKFCHKRLCEGDINARGKTHTRFVVALKWERYTVVPEQQDVMLTTSLGVTSLTKDFHLECRVADQRNWECRAPLEDDFAPEAYAMRDGELSHSERSRVGEMDEAINYTSWCDWKQVSWHDATSDKDDPPGPRETVLPEPFAAVVYWVTGYFL